MSTVDQIINSIIKDTPIGELPKVIEDLRLIINKNIDHELGQALEINALTKFQSVEVEGNSIILSDFNLKDGFFESSRHGVKFKVDFLKQKAYDIEKIDKDVSNLDNELGKYVNEQYINGEFLIVGSKVIIKGQKSSVSNFWTGLWISIYDLDKCEGEVVIDVHYYEDGNVRFQTTQSVELNNKNVEGIKEVEDKVQVSLNKHFLELNEGVFKNLRRQLPVTRSKINWGKAIGNYKLGKGISN